MIEKIARILRNFLSFTLYREIFRKYLYFLYEHVIPLKNIKKGKNLEIHPTASFHCGENITLEDGSGISPNCFIFASKNSKIVIGANSVLAPNTVVTSANHSIFGKGIISNRPMVEKDVIIGKNVWVGANCVILPGVRIGDNSVIGAGSIVSTNVPENTIACSRNRGLVFTKRR